MKKISNAHREILRICYEGEIKSCDQILHIISKRLCIKSILHFINSFKCTEIRIL